MSAFGSKRKAKIIQTFDDDDDHVISAPANGIGQQQQDEEPLIKPTKFRSKPAKSSALRKSINVADDTDSPVVKATGGDADYDDDESAGPVVVRPALSRTGSKKIKKRPVASSKLSFGEPTETASDDQPEKPFTPKKTTIGKRALENNTLLRRSASLQNLAGNLPLRFGGGEEDRPRYSKEYLEELQSSTPATPQAIHLDEEDADVAEAMELDPSEIEGALVVKQTTDLVPAAPPAAAHVLSALEIRERKDRRARLAGEAGAGDFIALDSGSDDEPVRSSSRTVALDIPSSRASKKENTRLIAEDEDLGEGYDEFVLDNPLALGKKAEKEATRRHRAEIAEMINAAQSDGEGDSDEDESDAERKAAYEAAQRRAGLDGLHKPDAELDAIDREAIPRMKPLPKLAEVLQRMNEIVQGLEDEVRRKRSTIEGLEKERREIEEREKEVQEILNQAGAKYQEVVGVAAGTAPADVVKLVQESMANPGQSPLRPLRPGIVDTPRERGLESFGTPTRKGAEYDDEDVMIG